MTVQEVMLKAISGELLAHDGTSSEAQEVRHTQVQRYRLFYSGAAPSLPRLRFLIKRPLRLQSSRAVLVATSVTTSSVPVSSPQPLLSVPVAPPPAARGSQPESGASRPDAMAGTPMCGDQVVVASTSIPLPPIPAVTSAPASVITSVETTSVATTSIPATTSVNSSIDPDSVERILTAYGEAMLRLDMAAVQRLYPSAPPSMKIRMDALRRDFSQCAMRFSNMRIVSSTAAEAVVRVDSVEACRPRTAQPPIETPGRHQFHLVRDQSGGWLIGDLFTQ
jgi:hypothetical protein